MQCVIVLSIVILSCTFFAWIFNKVSVSVSVCLPVCIWELAIKNTATLACIWGTASIWGLASTMGFRWYFDWSIMPLVLFSLGNEKHAEREAFEKCWAHSPLRAAPCSFTRCRYCTPPLSHAACASMSTTTTTTTTTTRDRGDRYGPIDWAQ